MKIVQFKNFTPNFFIYICFSCCCCVICRKSNEGVLPEIVEDNCCRCNYAALRRLTDYGDIEIIYVTYHVDVGQTPFFVALDYDRKKVVISIRGTLSMKVNYIYIFLRTAL